MNCLFDDGDPFIQVSVTRVVLADAVRRVLGGAVLLIDVGRVWASGPRVRGLLTRLMMAAAAGPGSGAAGLMVAAT